MSTSNPQEHSFPDELVGNSTTWKRVIEQIDTVACTDSTVLISGETGSGKEVVAQAIHEHSLRNGHRFVKVNCAAIPSTLLESELFGHDKGAFTGALKQRIGRFELAHEGTLLLDEVGDIPLDLQPKLLRVLQEHEIERLGSCSTTRIDVRVLAATHRDLPKLVDDGVFRADLYYRLNVFPITVPPLRDRIEDIPALIRQFVNAFASKMNKVINVIPAETFETLAKYEWPGNIRELQNVIERSVILTKGRVLQLATDGLRHPPLLSRLKLPTQANTLRDLERDYILQTLKETHWVVGGRSGAARKLGLPRTTLIYKMRKLNITRSPETRAN